MLQFRYQKPILLILWVVVESVFVVEVKTARNRTGKQFDLFGDGLVTSHNQYSSFLSPSSSQYEYYNPPSGGNSGSSQGYYGSPLLPSGPNSYFKSHSGPGPQISYSKSKPSGFSSGYFPNNDFSEFFSSSGYSPGLSQSYLPEYLQNSQQPHLSLSSSGYKPGKPPINSFGSYYPHYGSISASAAAASASGGGGGGMGSGSTASASASTSSGYPFGWGPKPSTSPPVTEESLGWAPPLPEYPPKPVPEFTYQFSLKPSAFGWETSYNVPCGSYKIQPRVIAHLRLATQAVLPKPMSPDGDKRRKRSTNGINYLPNYSNRGFDPFQLARSHHYSPYQNEQFPAPKPTFRPRTCRWNFSAVDGCKLNFKCTWFQLPALFRCDENYLHVSDETILLNSKFCGNRRPRRIYSSSTGKLTLTFKSEGAALPAIFDCTVLCTPNESLADAPQTSPAPTTSSGGSVTSPSSLPIVVHHDSSSTSLHQEGSLVVSTNNRNSTLIINLPPKQQRRMGNCKCGVPDSSHYSSNVVGRIVGGSSTKPGESPWTAALVKKNSNRPYCGAVLVNNKFLITAAHCVLNQTRKTRESDISSTSGNKTVEHEVYFDVLLNEHDITQANEIAGGTIRAKVDKIIVHPKYDSATFHFDAALIRLAKSVDINPPEPASKRYHRYYFNPFDFHSLRRKRFIMPEIEARAIPPKPVPICLPDSSSNVRNGKKLLEDYGVVTGWGLVTEGGLPSNEMLKARVEIFNDTTCHNLYKKHNYVITKSMMCAGYMHGSIDACVGDSGSPLVTEDKNRFVLAGVTSWGRGCARKLLPGIYTRVTELVDWIYSEASDDAVWCS